MSLLVGRSVGQSTNQEMSHYSFDPVGSGALMPKRAAGVDLFRKFDSSGDGEISPVSSPLAAASLPLAGPRILLKARYKYGKHTDKYEISRAHKYCPN